MIETYSLDAAQPPKNKVKKATALIKARLKDRQRPVNVLKVAALLKKHGLDDAICAYCVTKLRYAGLLILDTDFGLKLVEND